MYNQEEIFLKTKNTSKCVNSLGGGHILTLRAVNSNCLFSFLPSLQNIQEKPQNENIQHKISVAQCVNYFLILKRSMKVSNDKIPRRKKSDKDIISIYVKKKNPKKEKRGGLKCQCEF